MTDNEKKLTMEDLYERLKNDESWESDPKIREMIANQLQMTFKNL